METITVFKDSEKHNSYTVKQGEKYADGLTFDETLGLFASLIMPDRKPCIHWMQTEEQHRAFREEFSVVESVE